jgi:hypothetical protein
MKRLERKFEGPEVLAKLLADSGCELTVDDVAAEFDAALEEGTPANEVIDLLWEIEPRFKSPDVARRTFSNLFGLYEQMAQDMAAELVTLEEEQAQDPAKPLRADFVDRAWAELDDLARPELKRAHDRFDNREADVAAFLFETLSAADVGEPGLEAAEDLAFQTWWLCARARGVDSVPRPSLKELKAAHHQEHADEPEPALADLVHATLWELAADDERPLAEADIPAIDAALQTVRRLLSTAQPG